MREECDGVLVFTDLLGGTPFNQSMMIAQDVDNVEVLTGTNLPWLLSFCSSAAMPRSLSLASRP